jgi:hypothetical protein
MDTSLNPDATFDCLFLAAHLQSESGTLTAPELHLFAYLACLLWIFRGRATTEWGYFFVGTELGAPFSREIASAIDSLVESGYLIQTEERISKSASAEESLQELEGLALIQERSECLRAACASTAAFSLGMVGNALAQEPDLKRAQATPMSRLLLEDTARTQLYVQFEALRKGLHEGIEDLRTPAVVWLTALYRSKELGR